MLPHQERVIIEKKELDNKIGALNSFITASPTFETLSTLERDLLKAQFGVMKIYSNILEVRIERFKIIEEDLFK